MDEQGELEVDKSGMITRMIWMEYAKAAGWIPGLVYIIAALAFQILRVYTDLWLCEWMEESVYSPANVNKCLINFVTIKISHSRIAPKFIIIKTRSTFKLMSIN